MGVDNCFGGPNDSSRDGEGEAAVSLATLLWGGGEAGVMAVPAASPFFRGLKAKRGERSACEYHRPPLVCVFFATDHF